MLPACLLNALPESASGPFGYRLLPLPAVSRSAGEINACNPLPAPGPDIPSGSPGLALPQDLSILPLQRSAWFAFR